jgi:glycosyltransferase involved in cell wall biosynthesis
MKQVNLSLAVATRNEQENIGPCLKAVRDWVDEIVVVDGRSQDRTVKIAKKYGARVIVRENPAIFHINKQKALEACRGRWILQLDADEVVSPSLAKEIQRVVKLNHKQLEDHQQNLKEKTLLLRHQQLLIRRDGAIGRPTGDYAGFFVPRRNFFLGKYLRYGGTYPDGVIRLVKNGRAHFPCQSVHEQIVVEGRVGWLNNPLYHRADPTFRRYLTRNSRYIDLLAKDLKDQKTARNPIQAIVYFKVKPMHWLFSTLIRHKGILDGWRGVVFSFFSALRFPRAYWRYLKS